MEIINRIKGYISQTKIDIEPILSIPILLIAALAYLGSVDEKVEQTVRGLIIIQELWIEILIIILYLVVIIYLSKRYKLELHKSEFNLTSISNLKFLLFFISIIFFLFQAYYLSRNIRRVFVNYSKIYRVSEYEEACENLNKGDFELAIDNIDKLVKDKKSKDYDDLMCLKNKLKLRVAQYNSFVEQIDTIQLNHRKYSNLLVAFSYQPTPGLKKILSSTDSKISKLIKEAELFYSFYEKKDSLNCCMYYEKYSSFLFDYRINDFISDNNSKSTKYEKIDMLLSNYKLTDYIFYLENYWMRKEAKYLLNEYNIKVTFSSNELK